MDVTLQRQDLLEIAELASNFQDSMLRLRTDENRLIISATGRTSPENPISKVVPDTLLPAVVSTPGTANGDPAELARQTRALTTVRARLVAMPAWPGFELTGFDPGLPAQPATRQPVIPEPAAAQPETSQPTPLPDPPVRPATFDMSPYVAALIDSRAIRMRKPWTVPVFGILTLGIYLLVWYYRINRELRDLGAVSGEPGRALDVKPGRSTLAVSLGALLIVPLVVSINHTFHRIQNAQRLTNTPGPNLSAGKAWGLFVLVIPFWTGYAQANLNRIWHEQLRRSLAEAPVSALEAPAEVVEDDLTPELPAATPNSELWPVATEAVVPAPEPSPLPPPPVAVPVPVVASAPVEDSLPPMEPMSPPAPPAEPVPARSTPLLEERPPAAPAPAAAPLPEPAPSPVSAPRAVEPAPAPKPDRNDPAIETIRGRYARGEITRQEYRELLDDLA